MAIVICMPVVDMQLAGFFVSNICLAIFVLLVVKIIICKRYWADNKRTIKKNTYTSFQNCIYTNWDAEIVATSVPVVGVLDWLQIPIFMFLLMKIRT